MNKIAINLINKYQKVHKNSQIKKCRFIPTCSEYAKECYKRFSFTKASILTTKRLIKCNPFHKISYDPVPSNKSKYAFIEDIYKFKKLQK